MGDDLFRRRLRRFYEVHNPSCLSSVDAIWQTYHDREEDIFRVLVDKYGPEPVLQESIGGTSHEQICGLNSPLGRMSPPLNNFYMQKESQKTTEHTENTRNPVGPGAELSSAFKNFDTNAAKRLHYPQSTILKNEKKCNLREKLIDFYRTHNSSMIPFVDEVIENYNGNEKRMFGDLHCQYRMANELILPVTPSSFDDANAVIKRLSDALEKKTAETLALKKDKEYIAEELNLSNKLRKEGHENEKRLETQLLTAREQLQARYDNPELEIKTAELIVVQKDKERLAKELDISNKLLEGVQEKEKTLRSQLLSTAEELRAKEEFISDGARQRDEAQITRNCLQTELLTVRKECSGLRSTVFNLGNRIRVLEVEKQQLLGELKEAEKRVFDAGDLLSKERQKNFSLIKEVNRLKLTSGGTLSKADFTTIVKEIEKQISEHYESELTQCRKEINDYYCYAENQLRRRDALIAELSVDR
ncbi:hypothetical protein TraAM80_04170 [Trypanosoma rangeli]|uniref:Uncharacterized protein n=1 Tax=Trypanosoma rangeli TaxID=5698 RepID=A0A422NKU2_TRYRA|nr:uncharacterized protein TraAM80_04170 [Trypanosoma rangeli]RNF06085.1 hypothetical protein TraAM80_04170 [Trypanosoma rangeli]|eukprot:RNF06085.1 hypothetical protein TraAM80_04170 [Trypanosoma rangeli]